jgi:hypothetical protein
MASGNQTSKKHNPKKSASKQKNEVLILPSDYSTLNSYIATHKTELTEATLRRIKYALRTKKESVPLFKFKDSKYIVTLRSEDFYENVLSIIEYYLEEEKYELCDNAYKIKKQIEKKYV